MMLKRDEPAYSVKNAFALREEQGMFSKFVLGMAILRLVSGSIEIIAALIMLKLNQVEKALLVNSALALVGPIILISTTTIGLIGISDKLSATKILWIFLGVTCIFVGIIKK